MDVTELTKATDAIKSSEGLPIRYDVYTAKNAGPGNLPTILFLHGFKGFKDWGTFPAICQYLAGAGFAVIAMNFSLNGVGKNPLKFDRLDLFARDTFSQDLDDVGSVLKGIEKDKITAANGQPLNSNNIGVLGHSRGGQTAVAAAAEYSNIKCLVTWSAVADYNARWSNQMISDWEEKGVTEIINGRTGQIMPLKRVVYDDALRNADRLIASGRAEELNVPALFIHSRGDEAVSYKEAEKLYGHCASENKEVKLLPDSGHTFGTAHPFEEETFPDAFRRAVDATGEWFREALQ